MNIALITVGTRGDLEPFIAVGKLLRQRGHRIVCAAPEQYRELVTSAGLECVGLDRRFLDLVEGGAGRAFMGGGGSWWSRSRNLWYLFREGLKVNRQLVREQREMLNTGDYDRVVFHPKASFPLAWSEKNPGRAVMLSPVPWVIHAVPDYPHLGFGWLRGYVPSRWTYVLANAALARNVSAATEEYRRARGVSSADVRRAVEQLPLAYHVSPTLFPPPADWPSHVRPLGFHPRRAVDRAPPSALNAFMERHDRFVVITFGSMGNPDPARTTQIVVEALERVGIPAVINAAGGGLQRPTAHTDDRFYFAEQLEYDLVFPYAAAVVHHGGAGTTQTGLLHGCPTLIVPHIVDQFVWARLIRERGLGPAGIPVRELTVEALAHRISDLINNAGYREAASALGDRMRSEEYADALCDFLTG